MGKRLIVVAAIVIISSGSALADWLQYLGPNANATAPQAKLARSWPANGPKVLWTVSLAGDLILSVDGGVGILNLIEPSPEGFKRLANAKLLDSRECWAPLALSDGKLVIRDQKQMKCLIVGATR